MITISLSVLMISFFLIGLSDSLHSRARVNHRNYDYWGGYDYDKDYDLSRKAYEVQYFGWGAFCLSLILLIISIVK